jgi:ubiquinol-cytochrome c reductase cytochrome c subunit
MRTRLLLALLALAASAAILSVLLPSASAGRTSTSAAAAASPGEVTQGEHLYGHFCSACHGANGSGVETARQIGAAALRDQTVQSGIGPSLRGVGAQAADFYLRTGYMPLAHTGEQPHRTRVLLEEQQIRQLTAYIVSLAPGPPIPHPRPAQGNLSQGQHLFTDHCGGCHQIAAAGGYVTGAVPPSLRHASPVQVAEAVRIGPSVMPRCSRKAISDRQLDSIIAYVQYTKNPGDPGGWAIGRIGPVPEGLVTWFIALAALVAICVVIGRRLKE